MSEVILTLIIFIILLISTNEIILFIILGVFANKNDMEEIERLAEIEVRLNPYNDKILIIGRSQKIYVSHFGFMPGILSVYHMSNTESDRNRRIPVWSRTHSKIKKYYKEAKIN